MNNYAQPPAAHRGQRQSSKPTAIMPKLPAYGKGLVDRQQLNNLPFLAVVCVGAGCWNSAKQWNQSLDNAAMVLTSEQNPNDLQWPVKSCLCVIEWGINAAETLVVALVKCLLKAGALSVTVWPVWVDYSTAPGYYDATGQRTAARESIKTYHPRKVQYAA